ncbi:MULTISPECIES: hypothetical protein [Methanobacterium]|uniref:Uncharacterized protein n=1 Tax=Methanobacterium bryantii TaxID=2161 RepID=A0A2A2HA02_METBR|nr:MULTISPECIES: hypothetical protein [Methanobacterium]OEC85252.1 hypothetical protein A9507_13845 [Methanobacterium sp. A39]PAV06219.1 hypothetical protein ASJ80_15425 [Methanobacterium bryantii]
MISIITGTTTNVTMSQIMDYSIVAVLFLLLFLSLRNIIRGEISNRRKVGILMRNLNIVSIPLLIMFITIIIYRIYSSSPLFSSF